MGVNEILNGVPYINRHVDQHVTRHYEKNSRIEDRSHQELDGIKADRFEPVLRHIWLESEGQFSDVLFLNDLHAHVALGTRWGLSERVDDGGFEQEGLEQGRPACC